MDTEEFIFAGVVFPGGKTGCGSYLGPRGRSRPDVGTGMTNTSWGQVQSGLSWQELLLLSKDRSRRTGGVPLSLQVLVIQLRNIETLPELQQQDSVGSSEIQSQSCFGFRRSRGSLLCQICEGNCNREEIRTHQTHCARSVKGDQNSSNTSTTPQYNSRVPRCFPAQFHVPPPWNHMLWKLRL